jgi:hypothetical protein
VLRAWYSIDFEFDVNSDAQLGTRLNGKREKEIWGRPVNIIISTQ